MMRLPSFASYASVHFAPGDEERFSSVVIPAELTRAVPKRRLEFMAGRTCARDALAQLTGRPVTESIAVGPHRSPVWPAGIVGAITHAEGFAAAAVALVTDALGLGIDSEAVLPAEAVEAVAEQALVQGELEALDRSGLEPIALLTLVFSAKESLFKCLFPRVGRYFDFKDATVDAVDLAAGRFTTKLLVPLSGGLPAETRLEGTFAIADRLVHTGIWLGV